MQVDKQILARFDELLAMYNKVLATRKDPPRPALPQVDGQLATQWATSTGSLLLRVFGKDELHYAAFMKHAERQHAFCANIELAKGVLDAAKDDYEHGHLFRLKNLVQAELFDDFLEQATHLLEMKYNQPAAVVAGCVLEDALRKLCAKHEIEIGDKPKLDKMNADLAKKDVYNLLTQKKITWMADIRNRAAHGRDEPFTEADVRDLIAGVRRLLEDHLA